MTLRYRFHGLVRVVEGLLPVWAVYYDEGGEGGVKYYIGLVE